MRQRPYRTLREVNVWQRGLSLVRAAYGGRPPAAPSRPPAALGRGLKAPRRGSTGAAGHTNSAEPVQANLGVLAALAGGRESAPGGGTLPKIGHANPPQRCGTAADVHLSIGSRLIAAARDPQAKGLHLATQASLGPATRRNFRAWRRGTDFTQAAVQSKGGLWRRLLLGKLFARKVKAQGSPLSKFVAGHGPEALRIALRNAARRKGLASVRPAPAGGPPQTGRWGQLQRQLKTENSLATAKSFRDARWRQLGLGLLSKVFRRNLEKSAQPPYRPAGALPSTTTLPGAAKDNKLK